MNVNRTSAPLVVAGCVVLMHVATAFAQAPAPPGQLQSPPPGAQGEFVLERKHMRVRFERDGKGERTLILRAKVWTEQAVREWGQVPLPYMPETEDLVVDRVRVEKADGTVTSDAAGSIQDLSVRPPGGMPVFVDLRQKVIAVAALRPGDIVEIQATWKLRTALAPNHYWFEYSFIDGATVLDERLEIDIPADARPILRVKPGAPNELNGGRIQGDRKVYRWATKHEYSPDAAAKGTQEPPPTDGSPADVRLTTFQKWEDVAAWFGGLMPVESDPVVVAQAQELTKGVTDRFKKIEAIYDYVAREIRYLSLSFGIGRFAPHSPAEVLKNKYGDCKDKVALLVAMLGVAGIEALPVLLHTERSLDEALASPVEVNHVVAVVPDGDDVSRWIWMDATAEIAPVGMLARAIRDRRALVVGGKRLSARLLRTPADPPGTWVDTINVQGTVDAIGTLTASATFTLQGDSEFLARSLLRMAPAEGSKEFIRALAKEAGLNGEFSEETASDPAATKQPLTLRVKVRMSGFLDWAAARSELKTLPRSAPPFAKEEDRRGESELDLGSPSRGILRASLDLPSGYTLHPPMPVTLTGDGFSYSSKYDVSGTRLTIERTFDWRARKIPAAKFGEYSAFVGAVLSDLAQTVRVEGAAASMPAVPPDATASELYAAAYNAYQAGRFDAAAMLWSKTTEIDPKMLSAWNSLGLAYDRLQEYSKAVAAFEKALSLDPFDKRTYGDLGRTRRNAGQLNEAAAAFTKHLEINPTDGDVALELGTTLGSLRRYRDAAAALEKAAAAGKLTAWGYAVLGQAYMELKQPDRAALAFDRALAIAKAPAPDVWTKIGWVLADSNGDPERARSLSLQTLKYAATEMRDVDASGVTADRADLMERVAWSWDALALLAYKAGRLEEAEGYARAAWKLGREADMALNLARIYEKRERLADAANYYLTAYTIAESPSDELQGHVKRLLGDEERLKGMLPSASLLALSLIKLPDTGPSGRARYTIIVGADGRVLDLKFKDGSDALRSLENSLREIKPDVEFPPESPSRLALTLYVACGEPAGCAVTSVFPPDVKPRR